MQEKENKSNIKILFRVFNYVKPFLGLLFFTIFLNSIFSILTTLSISMIKPIFQILFSVKQEVGKTNIGALEELKNTFYKFVFDFTKSSSNEMTIVNLGFLIILIFLLKNIAKYFSSIYSTKLEEGILKNIRGSVFSSLTGLSVNFFSKNKSGNSKDDQICFGG